jgi:hypothetical protein
VERYRDGGMGRFIGQIKDIRRIKEKEEDIY